MRKRFRVVVCLGVILTQLQFGMLVKAETVKQDPIEESTIPTISSDPIEESMKKVPEIQTSETTSSSSEEPSDESESESSKEVEPKPSSEEQEETSESSTNEDKKKDNVSPKAVKYLVEGVDIDKDLSYRLRNEYQATNLGMNWSGYKKAEGMLTTSDMEVISEMNLWTNPDAIEGLRVKYLLGIEYAKNLKVLNCSYNFLKEIDVSGLPNLERLDCSGQDYMFNKFGENALTKLTLKNDNLSVLICDRTKLTTLNTSGAPNLLELHCSNNSSLQTLNTTLNSTLTTLVCNNSGLRSLDVSTMRKLEKLQCINNSISSLNASTLTSLKVLYCERNSIDYSNSGGPLKLPANGALTNLTCDSKAVGSILDVSGHKSLQELILNTASNKGPVENLKLPASNTLTKLVVNNNKFKKTENLDISSQTALTYLDIKDNLLTNELDTSKLLNLVELTCDNNSLERIDCSKNNNLKRLSCFGNDLPELILPSKNSKLEKLFCYKNKLSDLDISTQLSLTTFDCSSNSLTELDLTKQNKLISVDCSTNSLTGLTLPSQNVLSRVDCSTNSLTEMDFSSRVALQTIDCSNNDLVKLNVQGLPVLNTLTCSDNDLTELDVQGIPYLQILTCFNNKISSLKIGTHPRFYKIDCSNNEISDISNLSGLRILSEIDFSRNKISDITSLNGLKYLSDFNIGSQVIEMPSPHITIKGSSEVIKLKTTAEKGLSISDSNIKGIPTPSFNISGDKILIDNLSRNALNDKYLTFQYDKAQLTEGAETETKVFNGTINLYKVSDLQSEVKANKKICDSNDEISWSWKITGWNEVPARSVKPTLVLPEELVLDPASIKLNGREFTGSLDGAEAFVNEIAEEDVYEFTFKTAVAKGKPEQWLIAKTSLEWSDTSTDDPRSISSSGEVLVKDEEQNYYDRDNEDFAILSSPKRFYYGTKKVSASEKTYTLNPEDYQSNTEVKEEGFRTRIKNDRSDKGQSYWQLTAQLTTFVDEHGFKMPNGDGTKLEFSGLDFRSVVNAGTSNERLDMNEGGVEPPNLIAGSRTVEAGGSPQVIMGSNDGKKSTGVWQVKMPFAKTKLVMPKNAGLVMSENAGKKQTNYSAKLIWSLDDIPTP